MNSYDYIPDWWITTCFVVKQIDSDIPAEVVPKMQSLPQHAKNLLNAFGVGSISYRSQCLLVEQAGDGNGATNYAFRTGLICLQRIGLY